MGSMRCWGLGDVSVVDLAESGRRDELGDV